MIKKEEKKKKKRILLLTRISKYVIISYQRKGVAEMKLADALKKTGAGTDWARVNRGVSRVMGVKNAFSLDENGFASGGLDITLHCQGTITRIVAQIEANKDNAGYIKAVAMADKIAEVLK